MLHRDSLCRTRRTAQAKRRPPKRSCTITRTALMPRIITTCTRRIRLRAARSVPHSPFSRSSRSAAAPRSPGSRAQGDPGTLNETAAQTNAEQMLRNIVRLRYGDTPYFLEVSSVSTSATVSANVARERRWCRWASIRRSPQARAWRLSQTPSFVFQPLAGEKFAKQLLRPLDLRTLALLRAAGFGLREILLVFADAINGVPNAPAATLYAPRVMPDWSSFQPRRRPDRAPRVRGLAAARRRLRRRCASRRARPRSVTVDRSRRGRERRVPGVRRPAQPRSAGTHLPRGSGSGWRWGPQHRVAAAIDPRGDAFPVQGRRRARCRRRGRTGAGTERRRGSAVRLEPDAGRRHPHRLPRRRPGDAYVRVRAHERWFYIDARDIASKQTFALLETAYALQAGDVPPVTTILTLPIAR